MRYGRLNNSLGDFFFYENLKIRQTLVVQRAKRGVA